MVDGRMIALVNTDSASHRSVKWDTSASETSKGKSWSTSGSTGWTKTERWSQGRKVTTAECSYYTHPNLQKSGKETSWCDSSLIRLTLWFSYSKATQICFKLSPFVSVTCRETSTCTVREISIYTVRLCKVSHLELEGSEIFILAACPLWETY